MAPPPLLRLDDIHLTFGGTPLFRGAALSLSAGDRIATGTFLYLQIQTGDFPAFYYLDFDS